MPRYGYHCAVCNADFDLFRPMRESGEPGVCPSGHLGARRTFHGVVANGQRGALPSIEEVQARHHTAEHGHGHSYGPGSAHSHH